LKKISLNASALLIIGWLFATGNLLAEEPTKVEVAPVQQGGKKLTPEKKAQQKKAPATAPKAAKKCRRNPAIPKQKIDIMERICVAKNLLSSGQQAEAKYCKKIIRVCTGKGKNRKCTDKKISRFCGRSVLLASMDADDGMIKVVEISSEGKSSVKGYAIRLLSRDGVDSEYDVSSPPGQLVIGIQFPLQIRTSQGLKLERAIYTPYSKELREKFPELVTLGWQYLNTGLATARTKIEKEGVTEIKRILTKVILTLVLIEHFSNEELEDDQLEEEIYRVALTLGANQEKAYRYSVSGVGARGIGQFMQITWKSLHRRYLGLLPKDFFQGSAQHPSALIAQFLLANEDLNFLFSHKGWRTTEKQAAFLVDSRQVGEYLALSYNGGAPRAYRWLVSGRTMTLPKEGTKYIRKFNQVWQYLTDLKTPGQ